MGTPDGQPDRPLDTWHSHHAVDYEIAGTRIVSNPKGYPGERCGFCPDLIVEI
jgi:hypothetical protein